MQLWTSNVFLGLAAEYVFSFIITPNQKGANYQPPPSPLSKLGDGHFSGHGSFGNFSWTLKFSFSIPHHSLTCCVFKNRFLKPGMWTCAHTSARINIWKSSPWFKWKKNPHNPNSMWILQIPLRKLNDLLKCFTKKPHTALFWCIRCGSAFFEEKKPLL